MNPFTRFLRQWLPDGDLAAFVEDWDAFEALIIRVYKAGAATAADEAEFGRLRRRLRPVYDRWAGRLQPYWRQSRIGREPALADPFARLLAVASAAACVGDWNSLQQLPAAREALNLYIQAQTPPD